MFKQFQLLNLACLFYDPGSLYSAPILNKNSPSSSSMSSICDMSNEDVSEILDDEGSDRESTSGLSERDQYSLPLYDGSEVTVFDSYFLMFQFAVRQPNKYSIFRIAPAR